MNHCSHSSITTPLGRQAKPEHVSRVGQDWKTERSGPKIEWAGAGGSWNGNGVV